LAKFVFSPQYESALRKIEDHIFESNQDLQNLVDFLEEHDRILKFIETNPQTPAIHPVTGDQSWVFSDGRYRMFFRVDQRRPMTINLIDLIDNREANLHLYPEHKIPTYTED
jgi:hypothetical protein